MDADVLVRSIAIGAAFGGVLAVVYWWFRRRDAKAVSQAWMVFITLAVLMAARFYFLQAE